MVRNSGLGREGSFRALPVVVTFGMLATLLLGAGAQPSLAVNSPSLSTTASPSTEVGLQIFDNANLQGGAAPTGTITFDLFGPADPTCTTPIFSSDVPVSGNGSYNSARFTTTQAGTYRWRARYSGDANNTPAGPSPCSDPAEAVVVSKASTVLNTTASGPAGAGGAIHDTAVLAGGVNPTGSITFFAYATTDLFCSGPAVFNSTVPVAGNGTYVSADFTPNAPGVYKWRATYTGDDNNLGVSLTSCLDPNEASTVLATSGPTLTTAASPATVVGGQVSDTATLLGGNNPTGSITFRLYGPDDATCTGTVAFMSNKPVTGNGVVTSDAFTVTQPGTYRFVATYTGDANNPSVSTSCNDPTESVVVTGGPVTTSTTVRPTTTVPPTTAPPTTSPPTTAPPTTSPPTTAPPTTVPPTTAPPTTFPPTTAPPTTSPPTTAPPATTTTVSPTTSAPSTTTPAPTTTGPSTSTTAGPTTTLAPGTTVPATTTSTPPAPTTTSAPATTTTVAGVPGAPALSLNPSTVPAGQNVTVTGTGFPPGPVDLTLFSTPTLLARATVGPTGTFTVVVTIPPDTAPGVHRLVVTGVGGAVLAEAALTVTAAGPLQAVAQIVNTLTAQLSRTGTGVTGMSAVALSMVVLGLLMVATTRGWSLAGGRGTPDRRRGGELVRTALAAVGRSARRRRYPWD